MRRWALKQYCWSSSTKEIIPLLRSCSSCWRASPLQHFNAILHLPTFSCVLLSSTLRSHFTKFSWDFEYNGVSNMLTLQNKHEIEVCIYERQIGKEFCFFYEHFWSVPFWICILKKPANFQCENNSSNTCSHSGNFISVNIITL